MSDKTEKHETGFLHKFKSGKQVIITFYKKDCFMANSFNFKKDSYDLSDPVSSFVFYDGGNTTVEWCPPYGPISINTKCDELKEYAREDFFLGYAENDWTQLAVDERGLNDAALHDIDYIFSVLSEYA